jgi:hypothetical protein
MWDRCALRFYPGKGSQNNKGCAGGPLPRGFPDLFIPKGLVLVSLGSAHSKGVEGGFLPYCLRKRRKNGMLWRSMAS